MIFQRLVIVLLLFQNGFLFCQENIDLKANQITLTTRNGIGLPIERFNSFPYDNNPNDPYLNTNDIFLNGDFQQMNLVYGVNYKRLLNNSKWKWRFDLFGNLSNRTLLEGKYLSDLKSFGLSTGMEKKINNSPQWISLYMHGSVFFNRMKISELYYRYGFGSLDLRNTRVGLFYGPLLELSEINTLSVELGLDFRTHYNYVKRAYFFEYSGPDQQYYWNGVDDKFYWLQGAIYIGIGVKF